MEHSCCLLLLLSVAKWGKGCVYMMSNQRDMVTLVFNIHFTLHPGYLLVRQRMESEKSYF